MAMIALKAPDIEVRSTCLVQLHVDLIGVEAARQPCIQSLHAGGCC
jgi:hypothetical protein